LYVVDDALGVDRESVEATARWPLIGPRRSVATWRIFGDLPASLGVKSPGMLQVATDVAADGEHESASRAWDDRR
jgi:hypothetical protein